MPIELPFPIMKCPKCSATVDAACHCGVPYIFMSKSEVAREAIKHFPSLSDRQIANKIEAGTMTVNRVRRQVYQNGTPEEKGPEFRSGRDGKLHPARKSPPKAEPPKTKAVTTRAPTLEQRIAKLEKTYKRILRIREQGVLPYKLFRDLKALTYQPENVSEAKRHSIRLNLEVYEWLMAEKYRPTPTLTDVGIPVKEKENGR